MPQPLLSVVMPTFRDYDGVWATVIDLHRERLRLGLVDQIEIVVCDNEGAGPHSDACRNLLGPIPNARYVVSTDVVGTAPAKNAAVAAAAGEFVACLDSHVFLGSGVLLQLLQFWTERRWTEFGGGELDLYQGPNLHGWLQSADGNAAIVGSHFTAAWGGDGMHGRWAIGKEALRPDGPPFRIASGGCGFFTVAKAGWLAFHRQSRGFGGEETYIHAKYRAAGRHAWCLPWAQWIHRYGHVDGVPHNTSWRDRAWNYLIGYAELGPHHGYPDLAGIRAAHVQPGRLTADEFEQLAREAGAVAPPPPPPATVQLRPRPGVLAPVSAIERTMEEQLPCRHRGRVSGSVLCNVGCPSMQAELITTWDCEKHGLCTVSARRKDLPVCHRCEAREE